MKLIEIIYCSIHGEKSSSRYFRIGFTSRNSVPIRNRHETNTNDMCCQSGFWLSWSSFSQKNVTSRKRSQQPFQGFTSYSQVSNLIIHMQLFNLLEMFLSRKGWDTAGRNFIHLYLSILLQLGCRVIKKMRDHLTRNNWYCQKT